MNRTQLRKKLDEADKSYRDKIRQRKTRKEEVRRELVGLTNQAQTIRKGRTKIKAQLLQLDGDIYRYARLCTGLTIEGSAKRFQEIGVNFIISNIHEIEKGKPRKDINDKIIDKAYFGQLSRIKAMNKQELLVDLRLAVKSNEKNFINIELSDDLQPTNNWAKLNNRFIQSVIDRIDDYFD